MRPGDVLLAHFPSRAVAGDRFLAEFFDLVGVPAFEIIPAGVEGADMVQAKPEIAVITLPRFWRAEFSCLIATGLVTSLPAGGLIRFKTGFAEWYMFIPHAHAINMRINPPVGNNLNCN